MKQDRARLFFAAWFLLVPLFGRLAELRAEDRGGEVREFIEMLQVANRTARITALKEITNSGLTDRTLFDFINARLLEDLRVDPEDAKGVDEVSWQCKALASSGNLDYKGTLDKVAAEARSEKVRKYAKQSLGLIEGYSERNALLAKQTAETKGLSPEIARLINMLRAQDSNLKRNAAKVIYRSSFKEPRLYEVVSEELLAGVKQREVLSQEHADTFSWLCKALAASGNTKYRSTLETVFKATDNDKLRKYAKESRDLLQ